MYGGNALTSNIRLGSVTRKSPRSGHSYANVCKSTSESQTILRKKFTGCEKEALFRFHMRDLSDSDTLREYFPGQGISTLFIIHHSYPYVIVAVYNGGG